MGDIIVKSAAEKSVIGTDYASVARIVGKAADGSIGESMAGIISRSMDRTDGASAVGRVAALIAVTVEKFLSN